MSDKQSILVVEDDPQYLVLLQEVLREENYLVHVAHDGGEGMKQFRIGQPDLVITDLVMPNKEGIELIQAIRGSRPDIPIIAISGGYSFSKSALEISHDLGADDVLEKPFRTAELLAKVSQLLTGGD